MTTVHDEMSLRRFAEQVTEARGAVLAVIDERERWRASDLREMVAVRSGLPTTAVQVAICGLANPEHDGRLVLDEHLHVYRGGLP